MLGFLKEFIGADGYQRPIEGYLSWQHLTFVTVSLLVMVLLAVVLGRRYKHALEKRKNNVLLTSAIIMDGAEILKVFISTVTGDDPMSWRHDLPLFLCSIQMITIPVAALSKGRLRQGALDFICMFGLLGAVLGTYGAGNNYASAPVISMMNVTSTLNHCIAGFATLFIMITGMADMKKQNIPITVGILLSFCLMAHIANVTIDYNYMFLVRGDGTPYDIVYNLVNGHPVIYPLCVIGLFLVYMALFYSVYYKIQSKKRPAAEAAA